jgi:hypothetical protein
MKNFKEYVQETLEQKQELVELLNDLSDQVETVLESELVNLLISMVKMDQVDETAFDSIFDAIDEVMQFETDELEYDYDDEKEIDDDELVDEAQRALYKRRGYVRCPDGRIRKRGKCGRPVDRQKSRKMIKARKRFKKSFQKGVRKAKRTKRRMGMIK